MKKNCSCSLKSKKDSKSTKEYARLSFKLIRGRKEVKSETIHLNKDGSIRRWGRISSEDTASYLPKIFSKSITYKDKE